MKKTHAQTQEKKKIIILASSESVQKGDLSRMKSRRKRERESVPNAQQLLCSCLFVLYMKHFRNFSTWLWKTVVGITFTLYWQRKKRSQKGGTTTTRISASLGHRRGSGTSTSLSYKNQSRAWLVHDMGWGQSTGESLHRVQLPVSTQSLSTTLSVCLESFAFL